MAAQKPKMTICHARMTFCQKRHAKMAFWHVVLLRATMGFSPSPWRLRLEHPKPPRTGHAKMGSHHGLGATALQIAPT